MKFHAFFVALAGLLTSANAAEPLPLLPGRLFQAVILSADAANSRHLPTQMGLSQFWTPTPEEISRAETRIAKFIAADAAKTSRSPFALSAIAKIRDHPDKFVRQYFGAERAGERVIVCNAIPIEIPKDFLQSWRERYVRMADYARSWHIEYGPSKDHIVWFVIDEGY